MHGGSFLFSKHSNDMSKGIDFNILLWRSIALQDRKRQNDEGKKMADHRSGEPKTAAKSRTRGRMDYKRGETELNWGETGAEMDFWIGVPSSQFWRISPPAAQKGMIKCGPVGTAIPPP